MNVVIYTDDNGHEVDDERSRVAGGVPGPGDAGAHHREEAWC